VAGLEQVTDGADGAAQVAFPVDGGDAGLPRGLDVADHDAAVALGDRFSTLQAVDTDGRRNRQRVVTDRCVPQIAEDRGGHGGSSP
jgi:hypothetical protein